MTQDNSTIYGNQCKGSWLCLGKRRLLTRLWLVLLMATVTLRAQDDVTPLPAASGDPYWSQGRDSAGQLLVDSGALGVLSFASEYKSSYPRESDFTGPTPVDRVAYDWNRDGYNGQPLGSYRDGSGPNANLDLAHPAWASAALRHVLIKNWNIKNAYKNNPLPHVDVTQVYDSVGWGGYFVVQDSTFKNSDDGIVQWQFGYGAGAVGNRSLPDYQGKTQRDFGGIVVQGVTLNQEDAFVADAVARNINLGTDPVVRQGNYLGSWDPGVGWFINYQTNGWPITLANAWEKIVVIGSLPDFDFNKTPVERAFSVMTAPTAGQPSAFSGRAFHYPTIEAALDAGHQEPPFIRLSKSGWTVVLSAPAAGATVAGTVTVTADAADNIGVTGVQFKLDGANLGAEDTASPYSISWDTQTATDGAHTLTAVVRDAAGNTTTSVPVAVTVSN